MTFARVEETDIAQGRETFIRLAKLNATSGRPIRTVGPEPRNLWDQSNMRGAQLAQFESQPCASSLLSL